MTKEPTEKQVERENSKLMHLHVPKEVLKEIALAAIHNDVRVGRMTIEILRGWARRQAKKRGEE